MIEKQVVPKQATYTKIVEKDGIIRRIFQDPSDGTVLFDHVSHVNDEKTDTQTRIEGNHLVVPIPINLINSIKLNAGCIELGFQDRLGNIRISFNKEIFDILFKRFYPKNESID